MMKITQALIFILISLSAQAWAIQFEIESVDPVKKFKYGYIVESNNGDPLIKLWKNEKTNFITKKLRSSEYKYFVREWENRRMKKDAKHYKLNKDLDVELPIKAVIYDDHKQHDIAFDRKKNPTNYLERRIQSWLQYLELRVLRTSSLKFRRM